MAGFTESLTVKIRGDSQELTDELSKVQERLQEIVNSFSSLGNADQGLSRLVSRVSGMTGPLQNVSSLLQQVISQVQLLSNIPVSINVAPAIQALAQLSGMIASTAAQLQSLSVLNFAGGGLGGISAGGPRIPFPGIPQFDRGGLVQGRAGVDRIPAFLSHGEFVLRSTAVDRLGVAFLEQLNRGETKSARTIPLMSHPVTSSSSAPRIGEVHVHVQQPVNIQDLLHELNYQERSLRNNRG